MNHSAQEALHNAELGYDVMPCRPGAKPPLTTHGLKDATTDSLQIELWWTDNPNANLAIAVPPGVIVVDRDTNKETGKLNPDWPGSPERELDLAAGPVAKTPRGGSHSWFRLPAGFDSKNSQSSIAQNVDIKTQGGYVLVYPSVVDGKPYQWLETNPLDCSPDKLPLAPQWLLDQLAEKKSSASAGGASGEIPEGQRNNSLTRYAGSLRRFGSSEDEIAAALLARNKRCNPPLPETEVRRIARSVARYEENQTATLIADGFETSSGIIVPTFETLTSCELDDGYFPIEYLIPGVLVNGQPGILAGPKKCLKTNILIDLTLSLSSQCNFLNEFFVTKPIRVALVSGESGKATIQETCRRVAKSKTLTNLRDYENAFWCFTLPKLGRPETAQTLINYVKHFRLDLLILDPIYLCLPIGDSASNLFIVGQMLADLNRVTDATGCGIILCHHTRKNNLNQYDPPELDSIAWAGFSEFARQWVLLGRREAYNADNGGEHALWLTAGGSAGHSGLWAVDVSEGTQQDADGRRWEVSVRKASDAHRQEAEAKIERQAVKEQSQNAKMRDKVLKAYERYPQGETLRVLRESAGLSGTRFNPIHSDLLDEGIVEPCEVLKTGRKKPFEGFRIKPQIGSGASTGQVLAI